MPLNPEVRMASGDAEIVRAARNEVNATVGGGAPIAATAGEIIGRLEVNKAAVAEIKSSVSTPGKSIPEAQQSNSKLILENVAQALQAVVRPEMTAAVIPAGSITLLTRLSGELGDNITQVAAVQLYQLVRDALETAPTIDQLKITYKTIKDAGNKDLIQKISRVFITTATTDLGMTTNEADFIFSPDAPTISEALSRSDHRSRDSAISNCDDQAQRINWQALSTRPVESALVKQFLREQDQFTGDIDDLVTVLAAYGFGNESSARKFVADVRSITEDQRQAHALDVLQDRLSLDARELQIFEQYFLRGEDLFKEDFIRELPGGGLEFKAEKVQQFKLNVLRIFNKLYQRIDQQPDRIFREEFSEFHEGAAFRLLKSKLEALANLDNLRNVTVTFTNPDALGEDQQGTFTEFMSSFINEINARDSWREIYHDMLIYAKDTANIEKFSSFLSRLPISQVNIFLHGPGGDLVELARAAFERYISYDIATNDNRARAELFTGTFDDVKQAFSSPDYDKIKMYFVELMKARGLDPDGPDGDQYKWQIESALTIARGITFVNTLRLPEIIASATAEKSYKGNFLYDLAAYVNPQWSWSWGRGGKPQGHGLELPVLRLIDIPSVPKQGVLARMLGAAGKFIPKDVQDKLEKNIETETEKFAASWLDRQNEFGQLIRLFGLGGMHQRAGWRLNDGMAQLRKDIHKLVNRALPGTDIENNDNLWYDEYLIKKVGAAAPWYFANHRAGHDLEHALGEALRHHGHIDKPWNELSDEERDNLKTLFMYGEEDIEVHAFERNQSLYELVDMRDLQYKGDTFYSLLKRSPLDFVINITQLVPEVETKKGGIDAVDYWFADDIDSLPTAADKANAREFQQRMKKKWGPNVKYIKRVAQLWKDVRTRYGAAGVSGDDINEKFRNHLSVALERVRGREGIEMVAADIKIEDSDMTPANQALLKDALQDLIFNADPNNGFLAAFEEEGNDHRAVIRHGIHEKIDEDNFFYRLANVWFREDQVGVFPTSAEIDHRMIFKYVNLAGDNMNKRLVGDWPSWREAMKGVTQLDEILLRAANSHSLKEIDELHHKLNALRYINGSRYMNQANYYVAALVGRFFQEHYAARLPFPFNMAGRFAMGQEIALSRLSPAGKTAMTMNSDQLNAYFQRLAKSGGIALKGPWSFEQLSKAIGVDMEKMFWSEILTSSSGMLLLYLLWRYSREAQKEAEGGGGGDGGGGHH